MRFVRRRAIAGLRKIDKMTTTPSKTASAKGKDRSPKSVIGSPPQDLSEKQVKGSGVKGGEEKINKVRVTEAVHAFMTECDSTMDMKTA